MKRSTGKHAQNKLHPTRFCVALFQKQAQETRCKAAGHTQEGVAPARRKNVSFPPKLLPLRRWAQCLVRTPTRVPQAPGLVV